MKKIREGDAIFGYDNIAKIVPIKKLIAVERTHALHVTIMPWPSKGKYEYIFMAACPIFFLTPR